MVKLQETEAYLSLTYLGNWIGPNYMEWYVAILIFAADIKWDDTLNCIYY